MRCLRILSFSLLIVMTACVTEPVDQEQSGEDFLQKEVDEIISRLPYESGPELHGLLLRLIAFESFAVDPVMACLDHENSKMRSSAAFVLGQIRDKKALPELIDLTEDDNKLVRFESARAVLEIGAWDTIPLLLSGLEDEDPQIRYLCYETLNRNTGESFGYDHVSTEEDRLRAVKKWQAWWKGLEGSPMLEGNLAAG
jgi:hypothetical protein